MVSVLSARLLHPERSCWIRANHRDAADSALHFRLNPPDLPVAGIARQRLILTAYIHHKKGIAMQRIAALALCATLWGPNVYAEGCTTISEVVAGFTGGATGYGMVRTFGMASNWVSAGLFGAGMAVGALSGHRLAVGACDKVHAVMKVTAEIYCAAGEFLCESIEDVARSLTRDFQLCPECSTDEVIGSFLMEDSEREQHLTNIQAARGVPTVSLRAIARNGLFDTHSSALNSYYSGMQASFRQQRALQRRQWLVR